MKRMFKTISAIFALACVTLASCHNDKEEYEILYPIQTNLVGTWHQSTCLMLNDKGHWEATEEPGNIISGTYTFASDGNTYVAWTFPDGWQKMTCGKWKAEEEKGGYTGIYPGFEQFNKIYHLSDYELELRSDEARDDDGTVVKGQFRYLLHRIPDVSFSEKVAGRWMFGKSYEKKGGEWQEITFAVPREAWCDLNPDGSCTFYDKTGDNERKSEGTWAFNVRTKQRRLTIDGQNFDHAFNMPDANTMEIFYSTNTDPVFGEIRTGEFKDVMTRAATK